MKKFLKRTSLLALLAAASMPGFAQDGQIRVIVNGDRVHFDNVQPEEVDGRVLVPLRGVFEDLGAHVHWNAATETVNVDRHGESVEVQIGRHRAMVNDREVNLDVPPILQADTTMVPLRFISEALGSDVDWRPAELTVAITTTPTDREPRRVAGEIIQRDVFPANLQLRIVLNDPISSRRSQRGDRFMATVEGENGPGRDFQDAKIMGVVELVGGAIEGAPGVIRIRLDSLQFADGREVPISGRIIASKNTEYSQADDGTLMADSNWYRRGRNRNLDLEPGTELEVRIRPANRRMQRGDPGYPGLDGPMSNPPRRGDQNRPNPNDDGIPRRNQPADDGGF